MKFSELIWYVLPLFSALAIVVFLPWMIIAIVAAIFGVDIWMPLL